jgi:hypothetical protein
MILIGSHEDRAPDAESCARPTQLVELPALLDHPLIIQTIRRNPSGSDQIDAEHQATELAVGSSTRSLHTFLAS